MLFSLHVIRVLARNKHKSNTVVIPNYGGIGGYLSRRYEYALGIVSSTLDTLDDKELKTRSYKIKYLYELYLEELATKNASNIVCISEYAKEKFKLENPRYTGLVLVKTPRIEDPLKREFLRSKKAKIVQKSNRRNLVLYIGRYEWRKGTDILFQAWKGVVSCRKLESLELCCVGFETNEVPGGVNVYEKTKILGNVSEIEKFQLLSTALCLIVPSRYESFGIVQLEAFSLGTPVITSGRGALGSVSQDLKEYGLTFDIQNPESLCGPLCALIEDDVHWRTCSTRAREIFEKKYSLSSPKE
jgi:glycosyltransferase involved in cell wall biosynthesis